ncbi:MAG: hypothetical protein H8K06_14790 [Nitrospira sp.]|uniref:Uncharacterized protein n=1 Tax=Nitrospira defluvii TaxID=330214 RepID=A0ABM8S5X8_9BACT|nr:hypothetical protein [Nitrospira defluvii]MCS6328336.1 hypothetical protein [Nitrospira sp.]CAE6790945.1 conserved hypothetical protein [Nitrospira defluvii]
MSYHMLFRMIVGVACALLWTGVRVLSVGAAPVTFYFTGEISTVTATLGTARGFSPGHTFVGTYTFDTTTSDVVPSPSTGVYRGLTSFSVNMAGQAIVPSQQPIGLSDGIFVFNNEGAIQDRYSLSAFGTGPEVAGWQFRQMRIDVIDPSQSVFSNDTLPSTPPSLSAFAQRSASFAFTNRDALGNILGFGSVEGKLTSLSLVPIPPALLLFGTGVTLLAALRAAGRRGRGHAHH